jgi:hypothetical protein
MLVDPAEGGLLGVARRMLLLTSWEPDPPTIATPTSANGQRSRCFLANLTRQYYGKLVKKFVAFTRTTSDRGVRMEALNCIKSTNIEKIIKSSTIESGLKSALMRPGIGD